MHYAIVTEQAGNNYFVYVPDFCRGVVATGKTTAKVEGVIREAIELHLAGVREDGEMILLPSSQVEYVDVPA
ncbi:type II toxin-antitoxin system HicB family antitoxin [Xanthomonas sacchari]|uniref:type II toxin-antitoxin system HicB family antitoxin n=1 Tax=Xanthomonas sacchari TaxID=56458 RepID=UPI00225E6309|nr:type II toxin-antitoxin system HicB family antitoxin [Xanthomonas sacchari]MCW0435292.1 hypothetical protein [Xanthomonas sacchari]